MKRMLALILICMLLAGCRNRPEPVYDEPFLVQEGAYTLSDGTVVDHWQTKVWGQAIYQTAEGIELLRIPERVDIANVHAGGFDDFAAMDENVQAAIRAFYDENLPEMDIPGMLENAWSDYHASDREEDFRGHYASQYIYPSAANDHFVVYCVESTIPTEGSNVRIEYFDTIFDRRTGEVIDVWEMFSISREAAEEVMARKLALNNSQYPEIKAALEEDAKIRVQQGGFEFMFPLGTLSWTEYDHYMYLDCTELEDILQNWAVTEEFE